MWIVHYRLKDGGGGGGGTEESSRRRESFGGSNTPPHLLLSERDELLLIPSSFSSILGWFFSFCFCSSIQTADLWGFDFHPFFIFHPSLGLVFLFCSFNHTVDLWGSVFHLPPIPFIHIWLVVLLLFIHLYSWFMSYLSPIFLPFLPFFILSSILGLVSSSCSSTCTVVDESLSFIYLPSFSSIFHYFIHPFLLLLLIQSAQLIFF